MTNPWEVNDAEYQKNVAMFGQLTAGQPYMDAVTARNALMRSNLPTQVLSQVRDNIKTLQILIEYFRSGHYQTSIKMGDWISENTRLR